jgi:hypothetical protein
MVNGDIAIAIFVLLRWNDRFAVLSICDSNSGA